MEISQEINSKFLFPGNTEKVKMSRPPKEAYFSFPTEEEIVDYDEKNLKNTRRKIFEIVGGNGLTVYERNQLDLFKAEIEKAGLTLPSEFKEGDILRFLQSTSFNYQTSLALLKEHIEWRKNFYPAEINSTVENILNSGFLYLHGRDNRFRPIIVVKAQKYLQLCKECSFDDFMRSIIYFIEFIISNTMIPGQVETWNIIADLNNVSILTLPSDLMKMFKILQHNFRARLNVIFILGMNPVLNAIWSLLSKLVDANTTKKIIFIKDKNKEQMFEFINREQLEESYGGFASNVNADKSYFPPNMPSENYLKDFDSRSKMLVSEAKYKEMYEQGKLTVVSPFFLEKLNCNFIFIILATSEYDDVRSNIASNLNDVSVYENCREIQSQISNEKGKDTEENNIDQEFESCKNVVLFKSSHPFKDILNIRKEEKKKEIDINPVQPFVASKILR